MRRPAFLQHTNSRGGFGARKGVHNTTVQSSPEPSSGYSSTDESLPSSIRSFPEAAEQSLARGRPSARSLLALSLSEALSLTMMESPPQSDGESCAESRKEETKPENWNAPAKKKPHDEKTNEGKLESDVGCCLSPLSVSESYSVPSKCFPADVLESSQIMLETLSTCETDFDIRHSDEMSDAYPQSHLFTYIAQEPRQQSPTGCLLGCKYVKKGATVGDARCLPFRFCDDLPVNSNSPRSTSMPVFFNEVERTSCEETFQSTTMERYFEKINSFKAVDELLRLTEADFDDQFPSIESQDIVLDSTDVPDCVLGVTEKIYERNLADGHNGAPFSLAFDCRDSSPRQIKPTLAKRQRFRHRHNNSKSQRLPSVVRIVLLDHGYCLKNSRKDTRRPIRRVQEDLSFESERCKGKVGLSSVLARLLITRERLHPNEGSDWFIRTNIDTDSGTQTTVDERVKERPRQCLKRGHDVSNRDEFNAGDRLENIKSSKQTLTLDYESHESGFQMEDVDLGQLELETFDELWNNCFDPVKFAFSSLP